jgi:hypothetical protein
VFPHWIVISTSCEQEEQQPQPQPQQQQQEQEQQPLYPCPPIYGHYYRPYCYYCYYHHQSINHHHWVPFFPSPYFSPFSPLINYNLDFIFDKKKKKKKKLDLVPCCTLR